MALVRISKDLLNDSERHINQLRDKELASRPKPPELTDGYTTPIPEELITAMWSEAPELQGKLPKSWGRTAKTVAVPLHMQYPYTDDPTQFRSKEVAVKFTLPQEVTLPPNAEQFYVGTWVPKLRPTVLKTGEEHLGIFKDVYEYTAWQDATKRRWGDVTNKVRGYLNKCKSFNEAIGLWPEVAGFVPESYTQEVNRVVVKAPRVKAAPPTLEEKALTEADRQQALTSLTLSRLS